MNTFLSLWAANLVHAHWKFTSKQLSFFFELNSSWWRHIISNFFALETDGKFKEKMEGQPISTKTIIMSSPLLFPYTTNNTKNLQLTTCSKTKCFLEFFCSRIFLKDTLITQKRSSGNEVLIEKFIACICKPIRCGFFFDHFARMITDCWTKLSWWIKIIDSYKSGNLSNKNEKNKIKQILHIVNEISNL